MTLRQRILKLVYPVLMLWSRLRGKGAAVISNKEKLPPVSFYDLRITLNNGAIFDFSFLKGKKVMLVNTASNCGYTDQYDALQHLYEDHKDKITIIGFPANDFKQQEKGNDDDIAQFCKVNYGVSFPLARKSTVLKSADQNPVYQWLTNASKNGWNNKPPSWNFSKYIVDEKGMLTDFFGPAISPDDPQVLVSLGLTK